MNVRLIEAAIGALARMVPPETYKQMIRELKELVAYAKSADDRLSKIEKLVERVEFLENVVKNTVESAPAIFAEKDLWLHNNGMAIDAALAPAQPGALNRGGNPVPPVPGEMINGRGNQGD